MLTVGNRRRRCFVATTNSAFAAATIAALLLLTAQFSAPDFEVSPKPGARPLPWPGEFARGFPECSPTWTPNAADAVLVVDKDGKPRKVAAERAAHLVGPIDRGSLRVVGFCAKKSRR